MMLDTVVLIGIAAGALVFVGTILMVYFLLKQGGSFDRMKHESLGMPAALGEQKPMLYEELLDIAGNRELKPVALATPLEGRLVSIRNLKDRDSALLYEISSGKPMPGVYGDIKFNADEMIWRYMDNGPFDSATAFASAQCAEAADGRHYVITEAATKQPIGMLTLCNHSPRDLRIEIGELWVVPAMQGSGAVSEAVLLVLRHLFGLKYRRVEWRCDGHNVRARRLAHSMGFTFEGVLRKHRVVKTCNTDTVVFAVVNSEWPMVEPQLESKVVTAIASKSATSASVSPSVSDKKKQ